MLLGFFHSMILSPSKYDIPSEIWFQHSLLLFSFVEEPLPEPQEGDIPIPDEGESVMVK